VAHGGGEGGGVHCGQTVTGDVDVGGTTSLVAFLKDAGYHRDSVGTRGGNQSPHGGLSLDIDCQLSTPQPISGSGGPLFPPSRRPASGSVYSSYSSRERREALFPREQVCLNPSLNP